MEFIERKRKVEHLLRVKFPFSWAPPPLTPLRGPNAGLGQHEMHQRLMAKVEAERAALMALPDDELERRFITAGTEEQAKAAMRAAIEEKGRFFSKREAEADFSYWSKVEYWTLDESIALLLGKSPEVVTWKAIQAFVNISAFAKQYERLRNLALRAQAMNRGQSAVYPNAVLAWADDIDVPVPKALREALARRVATRQAASTLAVNPEPAPTRQITTDEAKGVAASEGPPAEVPRKSMQVVCHSTDDRRQDLLTPLIRRAGELAGEGAGTPQVWAQLEQMARGPNPPPPLCGITSGGVLYFDGPNKKSFTLRALRDRLRRARAR